MAKAVDDLEAFVQELRGDGSMAKNLNAVLSNLKEVSEGLNEMVTAAKPHTTNIVERVDGITVKLDKVLTQVDDLLAQVRGGEGVAGALVTDKKMKDDVASTLANLKDASQSVKDITSRVGGFKTYWSMQARYEPLARGTKGDLGVKISPRDGRYYYLGMANLVNARDRSRGVSYETPNTVDALMGWEFKGFDLYAGALRGTGGIGVKYTPFPDNPKWRRLRLLVEGSEFSRRRTIKERFFDKPRYDAGVEYVVNRYISAGMRVNDLQEVKRLNYTARVMFEDKDIAYLLGLASLGSIGSRASK
jgi:hypothetical protein